MGGNQALLDCADILPELRRLNDSAKLGVPVSSEQVESALTRYEEKMVARAFTWVAKSGGTWVPVRLIICNHCTSLKSQWLTPTRTLILMGSLGRL